MQRELFALPNASDLVILKILPVASNPKLRHPGMFAVGKHIRDLNNWIAQ